MALEAVTMVTVVKEGGRECPIHHLPVSAYTPRTPLLRNNPVNGVIQGICGYSEYFEDYLICFLMYGEIQTRCIVNFRFEIFYSVNVQIATKTPCLHHVEHILQLHFAN